MSCRSTPAGSAWTTFARLESGLTDVQTLSAFHALRAEGRGVPAPTEAEWERFVAAQRIEMEAAGFTEARVRSLNGRLDRAAEQVPDGPTWFALRNIRERTVTESNGVAAEIANLSRLSGESVSVLEARYEERLAAVERGRAVRVPEGYAEARNNLRSRGLPADHGTFQVLQAMRVEAEQVAGEAGERPRRVQPVEFPNSAAIFTAGYDPADGRLEVVFRRRDREGNTVGTSRVYAYHGIPASVWERMCGEEGPGLIYNRYVRNHDEYRYASPEEEQAAAHRRCEDCGQWWAPTHACPDQPRAVAEHAAVGAEVNRSLDETRNDDTAAAVVSQTPDGRVRLVAAVPVEDTSAETASQATEPEVEAPAADAPEPEVEAPAAPPRTAEELGLAIGHHSRFGHLSYRNDINRRHEGRYDTLALPEVAADLWEAGAIHPVIFAANWRGHRTHPEGHRGAFRVNGQIEYARTGDEVTLTGRDLQCTCTQYQENYDCEHVREAVEVYRTAIVERTVGLGRGINENQPPRDPNARSARQLGIMLRQTYRRSRGGLSYSHPGAHDSITLPQRVTDVRTAASEQPVVMPVQWTGWRHAESSDGLPVGSFSVSGQVVYSRPGRGQHEFSGRNLRCDCAAYQEDYRCPHVDAVVGVYRDRIMPTTRSGSGASTVDPARAQRLAEEALQRDWTRNEEQAAEARARHAAASTPEDSYTGNFAAFETDHAAALARQAAGEPVIPLMTSNALGGQFTRESGRGFGVELEFDFPNGVDRRAALTAIGRDLHEAGLTTTAHQQGYHSAARRGYTDVHQGGWSYEQDCTVAGEVVSPVMYDEPETWENIAKVCEIVRRHGGVANAKTGSHVHVGAPNMTTQTASELMQLANSHEDVMYRISQNPERPTHRPMRWCGPNSDVPQGGYTQMHEVSRISSHARSMNFGGVRGGDSDHPEIRYWDGTLDPAAIQTQIKVSCGMVTAAERNAGQPRAERVTESVGSHAARLQAVRGRSRRALTSEELVEDSATFRSFVDTLFTRREDKAQATSLFAVTKWQKSTSR